MAISTTGTLVPLGSFPVVDVANVSGAASTDYADDAAVAAASAAVAAIPNASAIAGGLATAAQIAKLDAIPADAQSASQVASAATAAVAAGRTTLNGTPITALTLGPGLTSSVVDGVGRIKPGEALTVLDTAAFRRSSLPENLECVAGCNSPGPTTWGTVNGFAATTGQPGPDDDTTGATRYTDNTSSSAGHSVYTTNYALSVPNAHNNFARCLFQIHPGNLRHFNFQWAGCTWYWDGYTGEFHYYTALGPAQGTPIRSIGVSAFARKTSGGWYEVELVCERDNQAWGNLMLFVYASGNLETPRNGYDAFTLYTAGANWTDNTRYFLLGAAPRNEIRRVYRQLDSSDNGATLAQETVANRPLLAPYTWNRRQTIQWCADGSNDEHLSCNSLATRLSGTAKPLTLQMLIHPQAHPASNKTIFGATGATASLSLIWGSDGKWYVSRTTDAGAATNTTSLGRVGLINHVLTLVYDGANVRLYQDTALTGTFALGGGATTFTACRFGASVEMYDAEAVLYESALTPALTAESAEALGRDWNYDPTKPWKVVLFGGQSLAFGTMRWTSIKSPVGESYIRAHDLSARMCDYYATQVIGFRPWTWVRGAGDGPRLFLGPELAMAQEAERMRAKVGIIKHAQQGSGLEEHWLPTKTNYELFATLYASSMAALGDVPYDVTSMIFQQWQTDALTTALANAYQANLGTFTAAIRAMTGKPYLPFVLEYPHPESVATYAYRTTVRDAMQAFAAADGRTKIVSHADVPLRQFDSLHQSAAGTMAFGRRAMRAALQP